MLLEDIRPQSVKRDNSHERLYHKDIGFPENVSMPRGFTPVIRLRYGGHAREEAMLDKYGNIKLPEVVDVRKGEVVEVGVTNNVVSKMVVRFHYDNTRDIVLVINPSDGFVRTVWANNKDDKHKTLNRAKYADPKQDARR